MEEPRVWWIRPNVSCLPAVFDKEPGHITAAIKYGFKRKHKGEVVKVIEYEAYQKALDEIAKLKEG